MTNEEFIAAAKEILLYDRVFDVSDRAGTWTEFRAPLPTITFATGGIYLVHVHHTGTFRAYLNDRPFIGAFNAGSGVAQGQIAVAQGDRLTADNTVHTLRVTQLR